MNNKLLKIANTILLLFFFSNCRIYAGGVVFNGVKYEIVQNYYITEPYARVIGYTEDCPADLTIPAAILYSNRSIPVREISSNSFAGCEVLKKVTIICSHALESAFEGCANLESVDYKEVPAYLVYSEDKNEYEYIIGSWPNGDKGIFKDCTKLKFVNLPSGIKMLDGSIFEGCTSLSQITLPESVEKVDVAAFKNCTSLRSINLSNVKNIEAFAFQNCTSIEELKLPAGLENLGQGAFQGCKSLRNIYSSLTDSELSRLTGNSDNTFDGIHPMSVLHIPEGTRDSYAFHGNGYGFTWIWSGIRTIREKDAKIISDVSEISNGKIYRLQAADARRGMLYSGRTSGNTSVLVNQNGIDENDENQQFSIYKKDGKYYLYNIGTKKFVNGYGFNGENSYKGWESPHIVQFLLEDYPGYDVSIIKSSTGDEFIFAVDGKEWITISDARLQNDDVFGECTEENGGNRIEIVEIGELTEDVQKEIELAFQYKLFPVGVLSQLRNDRYYYLYLNADSPYEQSKSGLIYASVSGNLQLEYSTSDFPNSPNHYKENPDYLFVLYNKYGDYYLYSLGKNKFVRSETSSLDIIPSKISILPYNPGTLELGVGNITGARWEQYRIFEGGILTPECLAEIEAKFIDEYKIVNDISQISNNKCYVLKAEDSNRGVIYAHEGRDYLDACGGVGDYRNTDIEIDFSDRNQQFVLYESNGSYYLYSVGQRKFVSHYETLANHVFFMLNSVPMNSISFYPSSVDGEFIIALDDSEWINVNDLGCVGNWYIEDGGNRIRIIEVGDAPADVLNEIAAAFDNTTALPVLCNARDKGQFFDLQGRRIVSPQAGVNIVRYSDGSTMKVLLK